MIDRPLDRDHSRIDLSDLLEVRFWCKDLAISEGLLREAIVVGGSSQVCRVRDYLISRHAREKRVW